MYINLEIKEIGQFARFLAFLEDSDSQGTIVFKESIMRNKTAGNLYYTALKFGNKYKSRKLTDDDAHELFGMSLQKFLDNYVDDNVIYKIEVKNRLKANEYNKKLYAKKMEEKSAKYGNTEQSFMEDSIPF